MDADAHCLCGNAVGVVAGIPTTYPASANRMAQNSDYAATGNRGRVVPVAVAAIGSF